MALECREYPGHGTSLELNASANGKMPAGATQISNDYGVTGFGGACPPSGEVHRYIFTVHALSVYKLDLPENPSNSLTGFTVHANSIESARITAVCNR
ncbi:YbhB/YbcL family Raf kinase inhibitor-like protein [Agrobacterium sp. Azo12]|nr:YbhB/YbcL family Raf kinase inhibitor-like protein [Agrobacterium sp. Azo12]MDO5898678.1 YbhB/YbcL family Raf kinase inhibitor-like protein [Agrobacterium sp. Azo12]